MRYQLELRQLRYFQALARELHFGRAAASVHLTQPPLSRQIMELERELGVVLFARNNRNVRLTEPGKVFLDYVNRTFELLDLASKSTRRAQRGEVGRLAIGYSSASVYSLLPKILRNFRAGYPDVLLWLSEMTTPNQCEALATGIVDIGIMRPSANLAQFRSEIILKEPFVVALPSEHRLARSRAVDLRSLAGEPFIMLPPSPGAGLPRQIVDLCLQAGFEPNVVQVASQTLSILGLVGAGTGIAIVPLSVRQMNIANVVYRELRGAEAYTETAIVWRKDGETPLIEAFHRAVKKSAGDVCPAVRKRKRPSRSLSE
jgi:DNA-binding transcriptional LysR family regulator